MFFELEHIPLSSFASLSGIAHKCQVKYPHFAVLSEWFCLEAVFSVRSRSVISSGLPSQALAGFRWCGRRVPTHCAGAVAAERPLTPLGWASQKGGSCVPTAVVAWSLHAVGEAESAPLLSADQSLCRVGVNSWGLQG